MDRDQLSRLEQLPNIGPAAAAELRRLGINSPQALKGRDPYDMYAELCRLSGHREDLSILDVFISVVRYMDGEPGQQWWRYTEERKRELAARRQAEY
ncbi:mitomycin resistance protein [Alkalilimnicola ehrlichii]|uniref:Mitomycin resistance protein n=1 Tax=Alkalilimnicola ehrlichii TaxID=351052 RepID=A0A3E0WLA8_9GAMM|nr:helix-hairpin-helix domain-containing protein [Alkalilimnicola ehrlichii]RFA26558.1 mitomycin resistance protein [Alkalilimnicola ehrlichii]RFA32941.1 mitomycin resistance protein [Alkalilimnicola ehrlichii]